MFFKPVYILILFFTIVIDYYAGIMIGAALTPKIRRLYLIVSIVANVSVLAVFKYWNFLGFNVRSISEYFGAPLDWPILTILLPIGLSFHTFQAMSYTIEVYRGNQKPEKHFGIYALYVMFFPQLVAGPIERPQNLLHQFREKHYFDQNRVVSGLKLMAWGFFKKLVIADRLSPLVDQVYDNPSAHHGVNVVLATFFFAEQIYCDFSGYTDIARGSARILGFNLMLNFRNPYLARSVSEFWSRWHISLSTWFKDYLYIPLGGNKVSLPRWMINMLITFLISGLWHGASWTFILWGLLNGIFIIVEHLIRLVNKQLLFPSFAFSNRVLTILLICCTWVFFRAATLNDALTLFANAFVWSESVIFGLREAFLAISLILLLETIQYFEEKHAIFEKFMALPQAVRFVTYALFISFILNFGIFNNSQFIYFQF